MFQTKSSDGEIKCDHKSVELPAYPGRAVGPLIPGGVELPAIHTTIGKLSSVLSTCPCPQCSQPIPSAALSHTTAPPPTKQL